jgi:hypothetical protein
MNRTALWRTRTGGIWWGGVFGVVVACSRAQPNSSVRPAEAGEPAVVGSVAVAVPDGGSRRQGLSRWTGTYDSKAGSIHVPDGGEWAGFKWRGDDAGDGIGEGSLSLTLDPGSGTVTGAADGVIGPVLLSGTVEEGRVTASVRRKEPSDRGLTGTLVAAQTGDRMEGTMRLSFGDAHLLREVSFRLAEASR